MRLRPLFTALLVVAALVPGVAPAEAAVGTEVRTLLGPGHAGLYGWGVAVETDGSVLVGDYWNFRVRRYSASGQQLAVYAANTKGSGAGKHLSPYGLAVDPRNGDFYFGDVDNGQTVDKYDASGSFIREIGAPGMFVYPAYVAVASNGDLYVADGRADRIGVFDENGTLKFFFGSHGTAPGQLDTPRGIAVDAANNLYVADDHNGRVQVFRPDGSYLRSWSLGGDRDMRGVAVDKARGLVYVVGAEPDQVGRYTLTGGSPFFFGGDGKTLGRFTSGGRGVGVDPSGNVWVGDIGNFRAQQFTANGAPVLAVPNPPAPPPCPGLNGAIGVAVDNDGTILATDTWNQRIERVSADGRSCLAQFGQRGQSAFGFSYPRGLAVDRRDNSFLIGDIDNGRVKKYDAAGRFLWSAGGSASSVGALKSDGIDVTPDGTVYVTDLTRCRIVTLSAAGALLGSFGRCGSAAGQLRLPRGVGRDPADGTLWVSDSALGAVQHFAADGRFLGQRFGTLGSGNGQLARAWDVAVTTSAVYVADSGTGQIKAWSKAGGFLGAFGSMRRPHGLDIGPNGHLYAVDQATDLVTEFALG